MISSKLTGKLSFALRLPSAGGQGAPGTSAAERPQEVAADPNAQPDRRSTSTTAATLAFNLPNGDNAMVSRADPVIGPDGVRAHRYHVGTGKDDLEAEVSHRDSRLSSEWALGDQQSITFSSPELKQLDRGVYNLVQSELPPLSLDTSPTSEGAAVKRGRETPTGDSPAPQRPRLGSTAASPTESQAAFDSFIAMPDSPSSEGGSSNGGGPFEKGKGRADPEGPTPSSSGQVSPSPAIGSEEEWAGQAQAGEASLGSDAGVTRGDSSKAGLAGLSGYGEAAAGLFGSAAGPSRPEPSEELKAALEALGSRRNSIEKIAKETMTKGITSNNGPTSAISTRRFGNALNVLNEKPGRSTFDYEKVLSLFSKSNKSYFLQGDNKVYAKGIIDAAEKQGKTPAQVKNDKNNMYLSKTANRMGKTVEQLRIEREAAYLQKIATKNGTSVAAVRGERTSRYRKRIAEKRGMTVPELERHRKQTSKAKEDVKDGNV